MQSASAPLYIPSSLVPVHSAPTRDRVSTLEHQAKEANEKVDNQSALLAEQRTENDRVRQQRNAIKRDLDTIVAKTNDEIRRYKDNERSDRDTNFLCCDLT